MVQRQVQTVKAHVPRSGEHKWNFSVSLRDVNLYPGVNLCEDVDLEETDNDTVDDIQLKAVVPDDIFCASEKDRTEDILWRRKFLTPLVDVWRIRGDTMELIDIFSKNTVPKRSSLVDDDDDAEDDDSPELYIDIHKKQLYIQESILMHQCTEDTIRDYMQSPDPGTSSVSVPRVQWKVRDGDHRGGVCQCLHGGVVLVEGDSPDQCLDSCHDEHPDNPAHHSEDQGQLSKQESGTGPAVSGETEFSDPCEGDGH